MKLLAIFSLKLEYTEKDWKGSIFGGNICEEELNISGVIIYLHLFL